MAHLITYEQWWSKSDALIMSLINFIWKQVTWDAFGCVYSLHGKFLRDLFQWSAFRLWHEYNHKHHQHKAHSSIGEDHGGQADPLYNHNTLHSEKHSFLIQKSFFVYCSVEKFVFIVFSFHLCRNIPTGGKWMFGRLPLNTQSQLSPCLELIQPSMSIIVTVFHTN